MSDVGISTIRAALQALPVTCRYHGADTAPTEQPPPVWA